ncbi:MAG: TonB-dependent receptor [Tannerella sp.]|jgi:TonB-linked SusC/RagA family outer membrane protein|nr:TonB-dependent receptor [Tannerella sp.]
MTNNLINGMKNAKLKKLVKSMMLSAFLLMTGIATVTASARSGDSSGTLGLQQNGIRITGTVVDQAGEPVIGANVIEKGTTNGTTTDVDGKFSLNAAANAILQISYIGYVTQEIPVKNRNNLTITLLEDLQTLDEVIVIGYGIKVKGALTGAISKVDNQIFETRPLTNAMSALQGAMPGVTVTRGSGRPGAENYNLQIRGLSSYSGNKPLILIDGVPGDMNYINPNDIADITVLKDAAASIYGARAADGVLLVTTKKGKSGKPSLQYSGNFGVKMPHYLKKMANTIEFVDMYNEALRNADLPVLSDEVMNKIKTNAPPDVEGGWFKYLENYPSFYGYTDWNKEIYRTGTTQSHDLSISGGGENSKYFFAAGYKRDGSIFTKGENHADRYNLRMNYDFKLFDILNMETSSGFDNQNVIEPSMLGTMLSRTIMSELPFLPVYNPNGDFYTFQGFQNPVQMLVDGGTYKSNVSKFTTNIKGDLKIMEDLQLVAQMGLILTYGNNSTINSTFNQYAWDGHTEQIRNSPNSASYANSRNLFGSYTAYLNYNKSFGKHKINLMAGASHEENDYQDQSNTGYNFISNDLFTLNMADKTKVEYINFIGGASDWALSSGFGRLGYSFNDRYFMDLTVRMDGSSKFAPGKRWSAVFPAASASWNLSEENFIKSLNVFDHLKLRLSWGQAGNQELSFGNYDYISLISLSGTYPIGSPNVGLTGAIPSIASEARTWETIESRNVGIDFAFLDSRLSGSFDYYNKYNNNMLIRDELPAVLGGSAPTMNIGKLKTDGWDFSIGWHDRVGDFKYGIAGIISDSKNKLIELKGNDSYGEGLVFAREGYAINSYFGYEYAGIIQNEQQLTEYKKIGGLVPNRINVGDAMFSDLDGDGKITAFGDGTDEYPGDMKYLGNINPRYIYSVNLDLSYKRFDLNLFFQGVGKRAGMVEDISYRPLNSIWDPTLAYFHNKNWTPENTEAPYPRIMAGALGYDEIRDWNWRVSSMRMLDMSYLRLKVINLVYNIDPSLLSILKLQSARVYVSAQDLFTFSKGIMGNSFDPEEIYERRDAETYPFSAVISLGLDIKF